MACDSRNANDTLTLRQAAGRRSMLHAVQVRVQVPPVPLLETVTQRHRERANVHETHAHGWGVPLHVWFAGPALPV